MEAPAKEIIEKAADVVESVGAVVTKRKRKRTRSPTTSGGPQVERPCDVELPCHGHA